MNIGAFLKNRRKELGITQEELAELVNVDERTIRRIENSDISGGMKTIKKICDALGISTSDRQLVLSMLKVDKEMNYLNPMGILSKLGFNGPKEILRTLEDNLLKAFKFADMGNYQEALEIYLAFSKLYPKEFVFLGCATMYQMIGEYEKSIEFSNKILSMDTYQSESLVIKGISLAELKNYDYAIEVLEEALIINKTYETHYNLGVVYWNNNSYLNAIKHYKECLKLNADFASAHLNIANCYFKLLQFDEFLYYIDEAIKLNPNLHQAYGIKGEYYRFIEQYDDAIKNFEKCLKLDNKNYEALLGISISFAVKEQKSESAIYFNQFFNLYLESFFYVNNDFKGSGLIIDIGYKMVRVITVKYENQNLINVYINGYCIPVNVNKNKNQIFIGSVMISDETGSIFYPMVGKIFQSESEFNQVITEIQKSVELFRYFEKPFYIDFDHNIKVTITERENNVLIEMVFGESYYIIGITDMKSGGLESFVKQYKQYKQFRIQLQYDEKLFIIDCLESVSINLLSD